MHAHPGLIALCGWHGECLWDGMTLVSAPKASDGANLQALLDATTESAFLLDTAGHFLAVNRTAAERMGVTPDAMLGRHVSQLWPSDVAAFRTERLREVMESGHAVAFCDWRDGRLFDSRYQPIVDCGRVVRIAVFARDVTTERRRLNALRKVEGRFRNVFDQAVFGLFQTTPDGRYLTANQALARMYGFDSAERLMVELTDIGGQLYVDPARRDRFRRMLAQAGEVHGFESEIRRRDGSTAWISESARAVRDGRGRLRYYEGMVEDVSERKRAELALHALAEDLERRVADRTKALQRAMREAEAAAQAKSTFLANMSHELRTPLNAVLGFSEIMRTGMFGELAPRYREYAGLIQDAGQHLLALINQVLDLAKIEAGKLDIDNELLDLAEVIAAALSMVQGRATDNGTVLCLDLPKPLPRLRGDSLRMKQVLLNLLSNAVKFTPAGGTVTVSASLTGDGGLRIAVTDTGPGIPAADLARVMEPFSQAESHKAREGTGLGLPLARRLTELHDGRLELESVVGEGTTVALWLPAERVIT